MRFLLYSLNFAPELVGIGKYSGEMAHWLAESGHEVRVITTPPYYPMWRVGEGYSARRYSKEKNGDLVIYRCPLWIPGQVSGFQRIIHLASFAISSLPVALWQAGWKPDVVFVVVPSLFLLPWALLIAKLCGAIKWLHIQDFELDTAFSLNIISGSTSIRSILRQIEESLYKRFDRVSTISRRMVERLRQKEVASDRIILLPNWVDTKVIFPIPEKSYFRRELQIPEDHCVVLYSGNMGQKQGLDVLIRVARQIKDKKFITFILAGEGSAKKELQSQADGLQNVIFLPLQPYSKLNELLNLADIHVLPQRPDAADLVMPSKLSGMLASGKPVIAMANKGTELGMVVGKVGAVVPPEDVDSLARCIDQLAENRYQRIRLGKLSRMYAEENWDRERILSDLIRLLDELVSSNTKGIDGGRR